MLDFPCLCKSIKMVTTFKGLVKRDSYQRKEMFRAAVSVQVYLLRGSHLIIYVLRGLLTC